MNRKSQILSLHLVSHYFFYKDTSDYLEAMREDTFFESKIILNNQELNEFTELSKELVSIESLTYINKDLQDRLKSLKASLFSNFKNLFEMSFQTLFTKVEFRVLIGAYCTTLEWIHDNKLESDESSLLAMLSESPSQSFFQTSILKGKKLR